MKNIIFALGGFLFWSPLMAQDSTETKKAFSISGYIEAYYNQDFNRPVKNTAPGFLYNFNRTNEVNLNLGYIKAAYNTDRVRGNIAFATGTYVQANYAAEPGVLKNIYEANIGVKMTKNSNLWLDAGIMPSHIGFESAIGKDNRTLTRSLVAENTPYFETGLKLGFTSKDEKWYLAAMYLNGWQRIQRVDGNSTPAFGTQITYKPSPLVTLNYSTFIGSDKPDSVRQMRYYNNFYGIFQISPRLDITAGFDFGIEQKSKGSKRYNQWYVPVIILHFKATDKISLAARGEYFQDKNGVIISTGTRNGFDTFGMSANIDYAILPNVLWRLEARNFNSKDAIFSQRNDVPTKHNAFLTTSLSLAF